MKPPPNDMSDLERRYGPLIKAEIERMTEPERETDDRAHLGHLSRRATALTADNERLRELLRWALPYVPEPLPSAEGGEFAENYHDAVRLAGADTGGHDG
jgi:hypothetical protein